MVPVADADIQQHIVLTMIHGMRVQARGVAMQSSLKAVKLTAGFRAMSI